MQPSLLENLSERLLTAGVAPRHVKRYLRELRDHYDDALREELAQGHSPQAAAQTAWKRLGDEEHLAQSVLSRPELRSLASRYPRAVFGAGPMALWLGVCVGTILFFASLEAVLRALGVMSPPGPDPVWLYDVIYGGVLFYVRILPAAIALAMVLYATRQRSSLISPAIGAAFVLAVSYTLNFSVTLSTQIGQKGELEIFSTLLPSLLPFPDAVGPADSIGLVDGLARAAFVFAAIMATTLLWRRSILRSVPTEA